MAKRCNWCECRITIIRSKIAVGYCKDCSMRMQSGGGPSVPKGGRRNN